MNRFDDHRLFYALPRTVIQVGVEVAMAELKPGKCAHSEGIARRLLGLAPSDLLREETTQFTIGAAKSQPSSEVDPENIFAVEIEPAFLQRRTQAIELSDKGLLESGLSDSASQGTELAVKTLELGAGLAGKAITMGAAAGGGGLSECEQIATDIRKRRDEQLALVSGAAPVAFGSKDTLELMLSTLRAQEARLLGEFTGVPKRTVLATVRCEVVPVTKYGATSAIAASFPPVDERHLLTVSTQGGVTYAATGCIVPPVLSGSRASNKDEKRVSLTIVALDAPLPDAVARVQRAADSEDGLFYRIPGTGRIATRVDTEVRDEQVLPIAQFGIVGTLPASTWKAYSAKYDAKFYTSLGALKRLDTSSTSADTAALGSVNAAVQPLAQAFVDREKAEAAAEDPLAQRIRQRSLIEERERIRCLREGRFPNCAE